MNDKIANNPGAYDLFILGSVLWVLLVGIFLFFAWQNAKKRDKSSMHIALAIAAFFTVVGFFILSHITLFIPTADDLRRAIPWHYPQR